MKACSKSPLKRNPSGLFHKRSQMACASTQAPSAFNRLMSSCPRSGFRGVTWASRPTSGAASDAASPAAGMARRAESNHFWLDWPALSSACSNSGLVFDAESSAASALWAPASPYFSESNTRRLTAVAQSDCSMARPACSFKTVGSKGAVRLAASTTVRPGDPNTAGGWVANLARSA